MGWRVLLLCQLLEEMVNMTAAAFLEVTQVSPTGWESRSSFAYGTYSFWVPIFGGNARVARLHLENFSLAFLDIDATLKRSGVQEGYMGDFYGGFAHNGFGYLAPWSGSYNHALAVVRFPLDSFDNVQTLNIPGQTWGCFHDDVHGYIPNNPDKVVRFSLETFTYQPADDVLNVANSQMSGMFFSGGFRNGEWGYLMPHTGNTIVRFSLLTFSGVQYLSTPNVQYIRGFTSNGYGYLTPHSPSVLVRFNLATFDTVESLNYADADPDLTYHSGGFSYGGYGYTLSLANGKVARFALETFDSLTAIDLSQHDQRIKSCYGEGFEHEGWAYSWCSGLFVRFLLPTSTTTTTTTTETTMTLTHTTSSSSTLSTSSSSTLSTSSSTSTLTSSSTSSMSSTTSQSSSSSSTSSSLTSSSTSSVSSSSSTLSSTSTLTSSSTSSMSSTTSKSSSSSSTSSSTTTLTSTSTSSMSSTTSKSPSSSSTSSSTSATTLTGSTTSSTPSTLSTTSCTSSESSSSSSRSTSSTSSSATKLTSSTTATLSSSKSTSSSGRSSLGTFSSATLLSTSEPTSRGTTWGSSSPSGRSLTIPVTSSTWGSSLTTTTWSESSRSTYSPGPTSKTMTATITTAATLFSPGESAAELLGAVEETSKELLADLSDTNKTSLVAELPGGGVMAVSKLSRALADDLLKNAVSGEGEGREVPSINVEAEGTGVNVALPVTMFAALGVEEDVAMVVSSVDPSHAKGLGTSDIEEAGEKIEVAGAAVIELRGLKSKDRLAVEGLPNPIVFQLPVNFSLGMTCAWWDEEENMWSSKGTWTSENEVGAKIECKTTHLSLFGAIIRSIVKAVMCVNVLNLFNEEAMQEVLSGAWGSSMGAVMLGLVLSMLGACFAAAALVDYQRWRKYRWQDEFLLIFRPPTAAIASPTNRGQQTANLCTNVLCGCCLWLQESEVVRQALDDIASSWFQFFGEARAALETCFTWLNVDFAAIRAGLSSGQIARMSHKVTAKMLLFVSRRNTAAELFINPEVVCFVLDDKDLAKYLLEQMSHANGEDWRRIQVKAEAWAGLREEITATILRNVMRQGSRRPRFLKTVLKLCLMGNPVGALFVHDILSSCKQRVLIFSAELLGALAVNCLFFEQTGMAKGKLKGAGCAEEEEADMGSSIGHSIGRFFVVAAACLLVAGIPVQLLSSLQTKSFKVMSDAPGSEAWIRQLRVWRFQERLALVGTLIYDVICIVYIVMFIANTGIADHEEWSVTGGLALLQDVLLIPFCTAMALPLLAQVLLALHLRYSEVQRDLFSRQVCELFHNTSNAMLPIERL